MRRFQASSFFDFFGDIPMQRQVKHRQRSHCDSNGLIVCAHVVQGASNPVVLPDKREFPAVLVGIDDIHDVAKLKITGSICP